MSAVTPSVSGAARASGHGVRQFVHRPQISRGRLRTDRRRSRRRNPAFTRSLWRRSGYALCSQRLCRGVSAKSAKIFSQQRTEWLGVGKRSDRRGGSRLRLLFLVCGVWHTGQGAYHAKTLAASRSTRMAKPSYFSNASSDAYSSRLWIATRLRSATSTRRAQTIAAKSANCTIPKLT